MAIERRLGVLSVDLFVKKRVFSSFSYTFLYKNGPKQKGECFFVSPNDPDRENLDLAFPHTIDSSCQRAMGVFLFALNFIYRHDRETCTSDRQTHIKVTFIAVSQNTLCQQLECV